MTEGELWSRWDRARGTPAYVDAQMVLFGRLRRLRAASVGVPGSRPAWERLVDEVKYLVDRDPWASQVDGLELLRLLEELAGLRPCAGVCGE